MGLHKPTFDAVVGIVLHQREVCGSNPHGALILLKINTIIIVQKKLPHQYNYNSTEKNYHMIARNLVVSDADRVS